MKTFLASFVSGLIFSIGLTVSGMVDPSKVKGFLDLFGKWDVSLAFVMVGAIGFNLIFLNKIKKGLPLFDKKFYLPAKNEIDSRLIVGSALFGVGWGLVGICPGPGFVNLVTLDKNILLFMGSMTMGMLIHKFVFNRK